MIIHARTRCTSPVHRTGRRVPPEASAARASYSFTLHEIARQLHPHLPPTPFWAYDDGSGLAGQAGSFGMVVAGQSGIPLDISFTSELPETYPDWIPVDTRLTALGNEVRTMAHLHGGFVAADSDGNPAVTLNGFGRGEYCGDHMLVNGKVWPFLDVEPRMYRFRILNGCNSRIMSLRVGHLPLWQIGAAGGMFGRPVRLRRLVLAPAGRADILVDFRGLDGRTLKLTNNTPAAPVSTPAPGLPDVCSSASAGPSPTRVPGRYRRAFREAGPRCATRSGPGSSRSTRSHRGRPGGFST